MDEVRLSHQEVIDLVHTILEGVDFVEGVDEIRAAWPIEMRDWCLELLDRIHNIDEGGHYSDE